jgi:hypothetical protein
MSEFKKVICIRKDSRYNHHRKLEIGKIYTAHINGNEFYVSNNQEGLGYYHPQMFVTLDEWRNIQLKELGL